MTGRARRYALKALQYGLVVAALAYVLRGIDLRRAVETVGSLEAATVGALVALTALEFVTRFSMWYVLLNGRRSTSASTAARVDLTIKFINHVIPSKASGHSVAPLVLRGFTDTDWSEAVSIAGLNTGLYASLYGVAALAGAAVLGPRLPGGLVAVLLLSTAAYLAVGALVLLAGRRLDIAGRAFAWLEGALGRVPAVGDRLGALVGKLPTFTEESARAFRDLSADPAVVVPYALGWAGTLLVVPGVRVWVLLGALGSPFSPAVLLPLVLVLAYSVTVLPLTPGGVGVAEASATLVFVALGVPEAVAVTAVLIDRSLGVYLPALLGWIPTAELDVAGAADRGS